MDVRPDGRRAVVPGMGELRGRRRAAAGGEFSRRAISAPTSCFRAICRGRPGSAVRRRSSSPSPARWPDAPISNAGPSGAPPSRPASISAGYLGAVENGLTFGTLAGTSGVGTHGGSEDHTAILIVPRRPRQRLRLRARAAGRRGGDAGRLAVRRDGQRHRGRQGRERARALQPRLAGDARAAAVRAVPVLRRTARQPRGGGRALQTRPPRWSTNWTRARTSSGRPLLRVRSVPAFAAADLVRRLRHFLAEDARVPLAADAFRRRDRAALGDLSDGVAATTPMRCSAIRFLKPPRSPRSRGSRARLRPAVSAPASAAASGRWWKPATRSPFADRWRRALSRRVPGRSPTARASSRGPGPSTTEVALSES